MASHARLGPQSLTSRRVTRARAGEPESPVRSRTRASVRWLTPTRPDWGHLERRARSAREALLLISLVSREPPESVRPPRFVLPFRTRVPPKAPSKGTARGAIRITRWFTRRFELTRSRHRMLTIAMLTRMAQHALTTYKTLSAMSRPRGRPRRSPYRTTAARPPSVLQATPGRSRGAAHALAQAPAR